MASDSKLKNYISGSEWGIPKRIYWCLSVIIVFSLIWCILLYRNKFCITICDYHVSEFLINFQGGFVRRGLLGEILLRFCNLSGLSPSFVVYPICIISYLLVFIFLLRKFYQRGIFWWLAFSPLICGYAGCIVRKDFLLFVILIASFHILRKGMSSLNIIGTTLLLGLGIFIHEAFIFYGVPVFGLMVLANKKNRLLGIACCCILAALFLVNCHYKGNSDIAAAIASSWSPYVSDAVNGAPRSSAVGAIGWDTATALKYHFLQNFNSPAFGAMTVYVRLILYFLIYYFVTNAPFILRTSQFSHAEEDRTNLSALFLLFSVCLSPMFICLSCDWIRIYQYIIISSLAVYLIFPKDEIYCLFPKKLMSGISSMNASICRCIVPTKWLMTVLLLTLTECPYYCVPELIVRTSIIGEIMSAALYSITYVLQTFGI